MDVHESTVSIGERIGSVAAAEYPDPVDVVLIGIRRGL